MTTWALSFGETFINELLNLPQNVQKRISKATKILRTDPISAKGDAKKLKGYQNNIYRIRIGDYRLIYSFGEGWVQLLSVRKRDERTYELEVPEPDDLAVPPNAAVLTPQPEKIPDYSPTSATKAGQPSVETVSTQITTALPLTLAALLLQQWQIPSEYWAAILTAETSEAILELPVATCNHKPSNLQSRHFPTRINCN